MECIGENNRTQGKEKNQRAKMKSHQPEPSLLLVKMIEDKGQDNKNAKEFRIKSINRYLKSTENFRSLGLISLASYLELHSVVGTDFLSEKECQELEWIELLLRMINQNTEPAEQCFPVLDKLLKITSHHPDMQKIIQSKYVAKIVDAITSNPQLISSYQCLETCLKEYSGPSGIFKSKLNDFCIVPIDSMNGTLIRFAGKCLHLLQQTRGGSVAGSAHKRNWAEFHDKLLNTLDEVFSVLMETGEEGKTGKSERIRLPEEVGSSGGNKDMPQIYSYQERFIRFKNLCVILETGLTQPFPAPKSIQLNRIISFIDKSTSLNQIQLNKKNGESQLPHILHIEIHKCLLILLQTVMVAVDRNILLHSKDICDILWKSLKSTNVSHDEFKISGNASLRQTVYNVLVTFMQTSPNNYYIQKTMENLMKEAFTDISPILNEILLTLPTGKVKKAKGNELKKNITGKVVDNYLDIHQMLCGKSLDFLTNLLKFNGATMKPVLFKILQDKILTICFKFLSQELNDQHLYSSTECRSKIMELCYNILLHPAIRNVTPMSFSIEILKKFKDRDCEPKLRHRAMELIRNIEAVLHNKKDPIHFPSDLRDFRDSWLFNEKVIKAFAQIEADEKETTVDSNVNEIVEIDMNDESSENDEKMEQSEEEPEENDKTDLIPNGKTKDSGTSIYEVSDDDSDVEIQEDPGNETAVKRPSQEIQDNVSPRKSMKLSEDSTVHKTHQNVDEKQREEDERVDLYFADFCAD